MMSRETEFLLLLATWSAFGASLAGRRRREQVGLEAKP